jgi:2-oxoglutarate ferredoxin oxidoreductase subunit alpha
VQEYVPYSSSGVTTRVVAGTRILNGKYPIASGLEHDEMGHPSGAPKMHMQMSAKRRKKIQALAATLPLPKIHGPSEGQVLLVGRGSTEGPIREAVDRARAAGDSVSSIHLRHINPLPNGLENIFSGFHHILVVEINDEGIYGAGQLGAILRARYCNPNIRGINKTDGLTYKVKEILAAVKAKTAAGANGNGN